LSILEQQAVEQYQLTIKENNTNEHKNWNYRFQPRLHR
jgi:hypothetical protein